MTVSIKSEKDVPAIKGGKPVRKEFLILGSPLIGEEEIREVVDTLKSGWLSTGPKTRRFEEAFKNYVGSAYAVALNSCTASLHLCLLVNEIGPGDEVLVSPMTFAATVNVIEHVGAKPVFVDIGDDDFNIDPQKIGRAITRKTKAVIPVHFAGLPCRMDEISEIARKHRLIVIEDAAHAVGSEYRGRKIGSISDFACFSFYATKNLTTAEGGMVTTPHREMADKIRIMSLHGMDLGAWQRYEKRGKRHYDIQVPGYKYNMTDLVASLGIHQLEKLEAFIRIRQEYAAFYRSNLQEIEELILPPDGTEEVRHSWHLYPLRLRLERLKADRDDLTLAIQEENIATGIHYRAVHLHPYYRNKYGYREGDFPNAEAVSSSVFSVPFQPKMTTQDLEDVVRALKRVIRWYRKRNG